MNIDCVLIYLGKISICDIVKSIHNPTGAVHSPHADKPRQLRLRVAKEI